MDSILVPAPAIITLKENETFDWLILGTLSNHDDEPSGRRPEVLERTRQPLRMSTLSSTSRSGREIQCFDVLRWTWVFQTIFNHFWAPFILFYNTVWAKQTFVLLFFEGWTAGAIFFFKESCPVFGWQRREGIRKYKCLFSFQAFEPLYLFRRTIWLKKGQIRWVYFPYEPRRVNKGHCIALHLRRGLIVFLDGGKKSVIVYVFLQSFWTIILIQIDYLT